MTTYNFGAGTLIGRRTDIANPTPVAFGVLQDIDIELDRTIKELFGQFQFPVDAAQANFKITGKAKYARIQANVFNDLFLGQTMTTGTGALQMVTNEQATIATTVTVVQAATFKEDMGVTYKLTGVALTRVASAPAVGQYSVNESTGVYTLNAGDVGLAANFNYTYGAAGTLTSISIANQLMGIGPTFEMHLQESYKNNAGVTSTPYIKFNACKSSKLSLPFKNSDYTIVGLDFTVFADASNNVGTIVLTE